MNDPLPESDMSMAVRVASDHWTQSDEIWVAEDSEDVRYFLDRAFRRTPSSLKPVFFCNGAEIYHHFISNRITPRLLLLDLQMPLMDGLEVLSALVSKGCFKSSLFVIFSSLESPHKIQAIYAAGAKLYLKKPTCLDDYDALAKLCLLHADALGELPSSAISIGSMEVKDVLKLIPTNGSPEWTRPSGESPGH